MTTKKSKANPTPILPNKHKRKEPIPVTKARIIAADPTAPAEILTALASHEDDQVGSLLAVNPNTPEPILHRLWLRHPLAILENPILAYRSFTTGEPLLSQIPQGNKLALYSALRSEGRLGEIDKLMPVGERKGWLEFAWIRPEAEKNIPPDQRHAIHCHLATDPSPEVRMKMVSRLDRSVVHLFAEDSERDIRLALAKQLPYTACAPAKAAHFTPIAETLSTDVDEDVRMEIAGRKCLNATLHVRLSRDPSPRVREQLAKNGGGVNLGEAGWRELLKDGPNSCLLVAQNSDCPDPVRLDLTSHAESAVRCAAWQGLDVSKRTLGEKLAQTIDALIADPEMVAERAVVAANRSITQDLIERLIGCEPEVTRALAANKATGENHLAILLQMDDEPTACVAMQHATSNDLLRLGLAHPSPKVRVILAGLPLPYMQDLRYKLAVDPSLEVRLAVFEYIKDHVKYHNGRKLSEILAILSHDPCPKVRARIIDDYRLPIKEVERMGGDKSVRVRLRVLRRHVWNLKSHYGLLDHKSALVRTKAAETITLSLDDEPLGKRKNRIHAKLEAKIAADPSPAVRCVLAAEHGASANVLRQLIKDPSPEVQRTLTERLMPTTRSQAAHWSRKKTGVLKELEVHRNPYIRAIAASSNVIGKFRARRLAADRCWYVRAMLAKNIKDPAILETLSKDTHPLVREYAAHVLEFIESKQEHHNTTAP
jgi:hypothetical protein